MSKLNSLILLVKSLSKSEKKALTLYSSQTKEKKLYLTLFDLIDRDLYASEESVIKVFNEKYPNSSVNANAQYLFELILQVVVDLNIKKNTEHEIYYSYLKTKILKERGLYDDYLALINDTKIKAERFGEYNLLLTLQRDELKSDFLDHFDHIQENELFKKQQDIVDSLKIIRQINEQSFLYEMLRFKIEKQKIINSNDSYAYNDLLISETTLVSNLKNEIFQVNCQHQLFQANYFMSVGSYKNALNAYSNLNNLFLENYHLWNNPPVFYFMVLEGILESLFKMELFEEMDKYKNQLLSLAEKYPFTNFISEVNVVVFIYSVKPLMHNKEYKECLDLIKLYKNTPLDKLSTLSPRLFLSLAICLAAIYIMNENFIEARKQLSPIIQSNTFAKLKLFRAVQLLNLIIYYEMDEKEYVESAVRSIKRNNKKTNKETQIEKLLFHFLNIDWVILPRDKRTSLKRNLRSEIESMNFNIEDIQLMKVFDFSRWMKFKLE